MQQIKVYLDQIATISQSDWDFFTSKLQRQVIPKKTVFLKLNDIENYISFMESGVVRLFIPKENPEKEKCWCSSSPTTLRVGGPETVLSFIVGVGKQNR